MGIEIYINDQLADFSSREELPFTLRRQTDKILGIIGSDGTFVDGLSQTLDLPATKRNEKIFRNCPTTFPIKGFCDGTMFLNGSGELVSSKKISKIPTSYRIEVLGDDRDPYSQLEGKKLCDLPLGTVPYDDATIELSWQDTSEASGTNGVSFAPVLYGETGEIFVPVDPEEPVQYFFTANDLRPHTSVSRIMKAIAKCIGFTVESAFQDNFLEDVFYRFCVGERWSRSVPEIKFRASPSANFVNSSFVLFDNDSTGQNNDANNVWDGVGTFTAPFAGEYCFVGEIHTQSGVNAVVLNFGLLTPGLTPFAVQLVNPVAGAPHIFSINYCVEMGAGDTFGVDVFSPGNNMTIIGDTTDPDGNIIQPTFISGFLTEKVFSPGPGVEIELASTLPCDSVKDFMRGLFYKFNIAARWDVDKKIFYYEPRFDYYIDKYDSLSDSIVRTSYPGYYTLYQDIENWDTSPAPCLDISETEEIVFSDYDKLCFHLKQDSGDPIWGAIMSEVDGDIRPLPNGVCVSIDDDGSEQEDGGENPYFHNATNASIGNLAGGPVTAALPSGYEAGDPLPEPTFECQPALIYNYGQRPVQAGGPGTPLTGYAFTYYNSQGNQVFPAPIQPLFYQNPPSSIIDGEHSLGYNDTGISPTSVQGNNRGLFSTFWLQWLALMREGKTIKGKVVIPKKNFRQETFQGIKVICDQPYLLSEYNSFAPQGDGKTGFCAIKWRGILANDKNAITHNDTNLVTDETVSGTPIPGCGFGNSDITTSGNAIIIANGGSTSNGGTNIESNTQATYRYIFRLGDCASNGPELFTINGAPGTIPFVSYNPAFNSTQQLQIQFAFTGVIGPMGMTMDKEQIKNVAVSAGLITDGEEICIEGSVVLDGERSEPCFLELPCYYRTDGFQSHITTWQGAASNMRIRSVLRNEAGSFGAGAPPFLTSQTNQYDVYYEGNTVGTQNGASASLIKVSNIDDVGTVLATPDEWHHVSSFAYGVNDLVSMASSFNYWESDPGSAAGGSISAIRTGINFSANPVIAVDQLTGQVTIHNQLQSFGTLSPFSPLSVTNEILEHAAGSLNNSSLAMTGEFNSHTTFPGFQIPIITTPGSPVSPTTPGSSPLVQFNATGTRDYTLKTTSAWDIGIGFNTPLYSVQSLRVIKF